MVPDFFSVLLYVVLVLAGLAIGLVVGRNLHWKGWPHHPRWELSGLSKADLKEGGPMVSIAQLRCKTCDERLPIDGSPKPHPR